MKWCVIEPVSGDWLDSTLFGKPIEALLYITDMGGRLFMRSKGSPWSEVLMPNVFMNGGCRSLCKLEALVKYGVTNRFVEELCE